MNTLPFSAFFTKNKNANKIDLARQGTIAWDQDTGNRQACSAGTFPFQLEDLNPSKDSYNFMDVP